MEGPNGLLIPVRDPEGRIIGCQVRADDARAGKYRWLSSARWPGGFSSGAPCHYALGDGQTRQVWITEGPLKVDLAADRLGMPVLGVAGVATWKSALPYIERIRPAEVMVAFDQDGDVATRAAVEQNARALA